MLPLAAQAYPYGYVEANGAKLACETGGYHEDGATTYNGYYPSLSGFSSLGSRDEHVDFALNSTRTYGSSASAAGWVQPCSRWR